MNYDYVEQNSLTRVEHIANLIAVYEWMDKQTIQGTFIEIQNDVADEIMKQVSDLGKMLKDG